MEIGNRMPADGQRRRGIHHGIQCLAVLQRHGDGYELHDRAEFVSAGQHLVDAFGIKPLLDNRRIDARPRDGRNDFARIHIHNEASRATRAITLHRAREFVVDGVHDAHVER